MDKYIRSFFCLMIVLLYSILIAYPRYDVTGDLVDTINVYLPVVSANYYAPPMKVVETVLARSRTGNYFLTGNLQNQGPDTVYEVGVRVHFFDEHSQLLQTYTTTAIMPANFPGQFNAFCLGTLINALNYPNAQIDTQVNSWTLNSSVSYGRLTLVSSQAEDIGSAARVQAVFRNDAPSPLTELHPLVWELHQYDYDNSPIPPTLAPGASFDYTIILWGVYGYFLPLIKIEGLGVAAP